MRPRQQHPRPRGPARPEAPWRAYCRRFDLEHTIRFLKQTLGWTTPRVPHPEQADRWTWLVLVAYAQLRLARGIVADAKDRCLRLVESTGVSVYVANASPLIFIQSCAV